MSRLDHATLIFDIVYGRLAISKMSTEVSMNDPTDQIEAGGGTRSGKRAGPGRPEVGGAVHVRLGSLLPAVDKWAELEGVSRAEAVRQLVGRQIGYELSIGQVTVEPTV